MEYFYPAMLGSPDALRGGLASKSKPMGIGAESAAKVGGLAARHQRRPHQTQAPLPPISTVMKY